MIGSQGCVYLDIAITNLLSHDRWGVEKVKKSERERARERERERTRETRRKERREKRERERESVSRVGVIRLQCCIP